MHGSKLEKHIYTVPELCSEWMLAIYLAICIMALERRFKDQDAQGYQDQQL